MTVLWSLGVSRAQGFLFGPALPGERLTRLLARHGRRGAGPIRLLACSLQMAVPKQKQSHARTAQRRAQHKLSPATYNECPQCHSPRRPHRVCPVCGSYRGREVIAETGQQSG